MKKMLKYLKMIGFLVLYTVVFFILVKFLYFLYKEYGPQIPVIGEFLASQANVFHIVQDLIQIPVFFLIFSLLKKKNLFKVCNFSMLKGKTILLVLIIGFASSFFTTALFKTPFIQQNAPDYEKFFSYLYGVNAILFSFWVIIHMVYREILFRGMILNEFKEELSPVIAVLLHGVMYGILFFELKNLPNVIYGFLGCLLFGFIYIWCKSLWAPILTNYILSFCLYIWRLTGDTIFNETSIYVFIPLSMIVIGISLVILKINEDKQNIEIKEMKAA